MPLVLKLWLAIQVAMLVAVIVDRAFLQRITTILWASAIGFILLGTYYLIVGPRYFAAIGAIGALMIAFGFVRVPEDPPHKGILTFWNRRIRVLIPEGTHLLAPYFPFMVGVNPVKVERMNRNFTYEDVRCRANTGSDTAAAGAAVTVEVAITIEPDADGLHGGEDVDADRIIKYLNSGGEEGVKKILCDIIGEETRVFASDYTWEEFVFLKAPLAASLLMMVSDAKLRTLPRTDGKIAEEDFAIAPDKYRLLPTIDEPLRYIHAAPKDDLHNRQREMEVFLRIVRENGVGDVVDLGIQITRLNVVRIEPSSALGADAELSAREDAQRRAERKDFDTELELARAYIADATSRGETLSLERALELVRINRGRAKETIVRSGNPLVDAAAIFTNNKD